MDHLCQFASELVHLFLKHPVHKSGDGQTDERPGGTQTAYRESSLVEASPANIHLHCQLTAWTELLNELFEI